MPSSPLDLQGTPGPDLLTGADGNDLLRGLAGNDTLAGGAGIDIALYAGTKSGYSVVALGGGRWRITDLCGADGNEGSELLSAIEKLRFADGDLQISDVGEFQVNTWVRDHQENPSLSASASASASGGWIAAWTSYGQDGDGMGAYAQRFGADGQPVGAEIRLNLTTDEEQRDVAVAALAGGGFAAVWSSGEPGVSLNLVGRRFGDDGAALGDEFAIDASGVGYQMQPAIVARSDGGFTVGWKSLAFGFTHFAARSFTSGGAPLGDSFQLDASAAPVGWGASELSLAALPGGGFDAAWLSDPLDGLGERVVLRSFGANDIAAGLEVAVGNRDHGAQFDPALAALPGGGLVAAWLAQGAQPDGADRGIYAQRLGAAGQAAGPVFRVSADAIDPYNYDPYGEPAIATLSDGGFVVTWLGASAADTVDVLARRYAADGTPQGSQFLVNTVTDGQQWTPSATGLADGGFVIAWRTDSLDSPVLDADGWSTGGIFAQRYNAAGEPMPANLPAGDAGTEIADLLTGTAGDDTLLGFAGDDTLQGSAGADRLDGGAGTDSARYAGPMADFTFSNTVSYVFEVTDTNAANGDEGRDALAAIERVAFADGTLGTAQRSEFVVASGGTSDQYPGARDASIARLADGRLVAAWSGSDGSRGGVFAQLLADDATALAPVFRVNTIAWLAQTTPSVAALPDGGFLIAWDSEQDGSESGIYLQRYTASATPVGGEARVNTHTHSDQLAPLIAVQPSGAYLVIWHSLDQDGSGYGVYGQRFAPNGAPAGSEFRISETTAGNQVLPSVAILGDGSYLIAWMSEVAGVYPFDADVYARRYASDGSALTGEFRVNTYTTLDQGFPSVVALVGGGFVVVWHSQDQDGDGYGVYGQRFAANGTRLGTEFRINTTTAEPQSVPTVAALAGGGFVVAWSSGYYWIGDIREYETDLYGQRFAADGTPVGGEFRINTAGEFDQERAEIVGTPDGGFLVAWNSTSVMDGPSPGSTVTESAVMAKRFDVDGVEVNELTVTGGAGGDTLRGGEGTQILVGGAGNDSYEADLSRDVVVELPGGGVDTLRSASTATLPAEVEILQLTGSAAIDGIGNGAANLIVGNTAANRLAGSAGDDTLSGGPGNDTIDGGAGADRADYDGGALAAGGYTVVRVGGGYTVNDLKGSDGTDTLTGVERLRFEDFSVNLTVQSAAAGLSSPELQRLEELYVAFFNRTPDADGLEYWIGRFEAGMTIVEIAESFYDAGVFLGLYDPDMTNADFVDTVYRNVLGREDGADPDGLAYWTGELAAGRQSRGSLVSTILDSAHSFKGDEEYGYVADLLDNKIVVADTFAVQWGLNYNDPQESIEQGIAIAAAVTPDSIDAAIALIGIEAGQLDLA